MNLGAEGLFNLQEKTVLLTGATGFLGRTMARALLDNGAHVIALGRAGRLQNQADEWNREYGANRVRPCSVDMYDQQALQSTLENINDGAPVDVLINNACEMGPGTGFNSPDGTLERATHELWLRQFESGLYWAALTTQVIGTRMKDRGKGSIINITTMYAHVAPGPQLYVGTDFHNPPAYSASKAALVSLTRYTASFWGTFGVRANAISPGPFSNTAETGPNSVAEDDPFLERLKARTCLGRIGRPHELAGAVLFLASEASSFMTGQTLIIDGGWTVT